MDESGDRDELRKQLEAIQQQAEGYKQQLKEKEQEAEKYKKQLSEINKDDDSEVPVSIGEEGGVIIKQELLTEEVEAIEEEEVS